MTEQVSERLLDAVLHRDGPLRLSVVGLSKNAGKTFTLNHIIAAASRRQMALGLISTGRDGEEQDAITELPKPRIFAPVGALVATAREASKVGTARIGLLQELPFQTRFGPLLIGRVEEEGEVLLIGPGSASRIGKALRVLEENGARFSLVDGSFDRVSAAAPSVTGKMVLVVGAAYSASMAETVAQVQHLIEIFSLPTAPPDLVMDAAQQAPVALLLPSGCVLPLPVLGAMGDPAPIAAALQEQGAGAYLLLAGALSDRLLAALVQQRVRGAQVIVGDATRILVDRHLWRRWCRQGGRVYVRRAVQVLALTINPHSPVGRDYDAHAFFAAVRAMSDFPVFDLQAGRF